MPTHLYAQSVENRPSALRFDRVLDLKIATSTLIQDKEGFLWIQSTRGLVRFDARTTQVYEQAAPHTLACTTRCTLLADSMDSGVLWLGTQDGLIRFDQNSNTSFRYQHNPDDENSLSHNFILDFVEDALDANILWVGTAKGLNRLDKRTGTIVRHAPDEDNPNSLSGGVVHRILQDRQQPFVLWLGLWSGGLNKFDTQTQTATRYQHDPEDPTSFPAEDDITVSLIQDKDNPDWLWIGTSGQGLVRFDTRNASFTTIKHDPDEPNSLPDGSIGMLLDDGVGSLWLASDRNPNGLTRYDKVSNTAIAYQHNRLDQSSLSSDDVGTLYQDQTGILWILSRDGYLDKYDPQNQKFRFYDDFSTPARQSSNTVSTLLVDSDEQLWIGTSAELIRFDPVQGSFTHFYADPEQEQSLQGEYISALTEDADGHLWVGVLRQNILQALDRTTGEVLNTYETEGPISYLYADPNDPALLWMGIKEAGLAKFNRETEEFTLFEQNEEDPQALSLYTILVILHDRETDALWLGGSGGLNRFDKRRETFTHFSHDPQNIETLGGDRVNEIYQDPQGILWLGVGASGLNRYEPERELFTRFEPATGYPMHTVVGILPDQTGKLWLGTLGGLIQFDPQTDEVLRHYTDKDGLQSNTFTGWIARQANGQLWFGDERGVTRVLPQASNPYAPPVVLTSFTQNGEKPEGSDRAPAFLTDVTLPYTNNYFEFEFAALNYTDPEQNRYRYFLEGFDEDWYLAGSNNRGRYSNLPSGEYHLLFEGSNNDGVWSEVQAVNITVTTPFWQQTRFRLIAALGLVALAFAAFRLRVRYIKQRNRELEALVAERTEQLAAAQLEAETAREEAETANQMKSTFLASMSHELRTPMNAIIGYSELLIEDAEFLEPEEFVPDLQKIQSAGQHLLELINGVLDLSKIEAGQMELYLETVEITSLIEGVTTTIQPLIEKNHNELVVALADDIGVMHVDVTKMRQTLFNLLSNAAKFTENGTITLRVAREPDADNPVNDWIILIVEDTGIGMTSEQAATIFGAFVQADTSTTRKYGGTGLGLAISQQFCLMMGGDITVASEVGNGSTFTVRLPATVVDPAERISHTQRDEEAVPASGTSSTGNRVEQMAPSHDQTVLVIDDEASTRELLKRFLLKEGFQVITASSGEEGLRLARERHPAIITLDVLMPQMDGWSVLRTLKADTELCNIPVIMMTMVGNEKLGYALGATEYMPKPINRQHLAAVLERIHNTVHPDRVLVVEDDAATRTILRRHLEGEGWAVIEAENGKVAIETLRAGPPTQRPGLILLDLLMPVMDGFEFLAALHLLDYGRQIPVVILTAKDLTVDDRRRLNESAAQILEKGATSNEELLVELRQLLVEQLQP